jgi:formamidopyrimidine-DNA glycosylase
MGKFTKQGLPDLNNMGKRVKEKIPLNVMKELCQHDRVVYHKEGDECMECGAYLDSEV